MPTEGINASSGGVPAMGARLLPTKSPSNPNTTQSPVMSMADAGSSGVTRARADADGPQQRQPEPDPDQQQQRAEHPIALRQHGEAGQHQEHRGNAEEEVQTRRGPSGRLWARYAQ